MTKSTASSLDTHFREVGPHKIPTPAQEYEIFTRYQTTRLHAKLASNPQEREKLTTKEQGLRNEIAKWYLRFVIKQARRKSHDENIFSELISAGYEGLLHAIPMFKPDLGNRFLTYAANWVNVKMQEATYRLRLVHVPNHTRKEMRKVRTENEKKLALGEYVEEFKEPAIASIENLVIVDHGIDVEYNAQHSSINPLTLLAQAQLTRIEKLVLIYAFGLRGGEPKEACVIGQILYEIDGSQMLEEKVEEVQERALARLREHLSEEEIFSLADVLTLK